MAKKFPKRDANTIQQATLCFLVKPGKVLLAMKKRGFGVGFWNGVGGKVKPEESILEAAKREASEEIGVGIIKAEKVALLHFYFPQDPDKKGWNQDVHVFLISKWSGTPQETEEMKPMWFNVGEIPFESMWPDDPYWLPKILKKERLEGWFAFDSGNNIAEYKIKNVGKGGEISS